MNRFDARRALMEAAEKDLSPRDFRRFRRAMIFRPIAAQAALDTVQLNCVQAGMVDADGEVMASVDWSAIIALIIELLPLILQLFGLG